MISPKNGTILLRFRKVLRCPLLVLLWSVNVEPAFHSGMAEAAKLSARKLIFAGLRRLEPNQNSAAGNRILLKPQVGQEKAVNHILRSKMDAHDLVDRNMQVIVELYVIRRVELAIRSRIDHFPVELLRRHLKFEIAVRRVSLYLGPG